VTGCVGSRNAQTTMYFDNDRTEIFCGCWKGTLQEFETRVNLVYPFGNKYGDDYRKNILFMKEIFERNKKLIMGWR
jgi:hypothetical protein